MTTKSVIFKNVAYTTLKDLWTHYNNVSEAGTIYSYGIFLKRRREGISIISSLFKG